LLVDLGENGAQLAGLFVVPQAGINNELIGMIAPSN